MEKLSPEVQHTVMANLTTQELAVLTSVSRQLSAISSNILFSAVRLDVDDLEFFHKALDIRFKACGVRSLVVQDTTGQLRRANVQVNNAFIEHLQKILQFVTQIRQLHLHITMHTQSFPGYDMDPRYPEVTLCWYFEHLEEFCYTVQGEYKEGGDSIHLPAFLNAHGGLKGLKICLPNSPYCEVTSFKPNTVLHVPHLEYLEAPLGYFACTLAGASELKSIKIHYPLYGEIEMHQNDTLLPHVQDITVKKTWGLNNVDILATIAMRFRGLHSLDIQGHYWEEIDNTTVVELLTQFTRLEIFQYRPSPYAQNGFLNEETTTENISHPLVADSWRKACTSLKKIRINCWLCVWDNKTEKMIVASEDWALPTEI
ncbi:hypothetical protein C8R46DRAFT_1025881 [Mycena filopes]|nr:hypothetical protein C8R46DRAFT_1025881 [Mycena filopes]